MKASVVELRYKMKEILKALRRNEKIQVLYHGKLAGIILPPPHEKSKKSALDHPAFGMYRERYKDKGVDEILDDLRGGRYHAV